MATIYGYHGTRGRITTILWGNNQGAKVKTFSGIGFELEITKGRYGFDFEEHIALANEIERKCKGKELFKFERDGSIGNGFEIISQPTTTRAFKRDFPMKSILKEIEKRGYFSENGGLCGLHVHVSRAMFGANELRQKTRLAKILLFIRNNVEDFKKISRRKDFSYCSFDYLTRYNNTYEQMEKFIKENGCNNHGCFINLGNSATIEFRFFRGTTNYDKFMASIEFIYNLVRQMQYVEIKDIEENNFEKILKNQPKNVIDYLKEKQVFGLR